jgi:hypothetical protein
MPGFPTPTNVVGVNANRRDPHKSGESPPLHEGWQGLATSGQVGAGGMTERREKQAKRDFSLRRPTLHWSEGKEEIGLLRSK